MMIVIGDPWFPGMFGGYRGKLRFPELITKLLEFEIYIYIYTGAWDGE